MILHWPYREHEREKARTALERRSRGRCEHCGRHGREIRLQNVYPLVVHHERYAPEITLDDLLLLCRSCHAVRHAEHRVLRVPRVGLALNEKRTVGRMRTPARTDDAPTPQEAVA